MEILFIPCMTSWPKSGHAYETCALSRVGQPYSKWPVNCWLKTVVSLGQILGSYIIKYREAAYVWWIEYFALSLQSSWYKWSHLRSKQPKQISSYVCICMCNDVNTL